MTSQIFFKKVGIFVVVGGCCSSQEGLRGVAILFTGDGVVEGQDIAW